MQSGHRFAGGEDIGYFDYQSGGRGFASHGYKANGGFQWRALKP
jgi:hypothetical protein